MIHNEKNKFRFARYLVLAFYYIKSFTSSSLSLNPTAATSL